MNPNPNAIHPEDLERAARRRAGMKLGWIVHAIVYAAVNLMLTALAASNGRDWAIYPALGWGAGLAIHGLVVYALAGGGLYERLLQRERARLSVQRDPW